MKTSTVAFLRIRLLISKTQGTSDKIVAPKALFEQIESHTGSEMSTKIEGRRLGLFGLSEVGVAKPIRVLKKNLGPGWVWKRHF